MRNENEFNAYLSKEFRARYNRRGIFHVKASDKFTAGVADFLVWGNGRSAALESKFVKTLDLKPTTLILGHTFTGPQLTFLESVRLTGNRDFGLIAVDDLQTMLLLSGRDIPESGNWTLADFQHQNQIAIHFNDVDLLLDHMLWE